MTATLYRQWFVVVFFVSTEAPIEADLTGKYI